jgi:glycerol-3-phosphate acyltransferase PlsY
MILWRVAISVLGAYLIGSIPFGVIIARTHGKDLRSIGSGNIGATNVARALGRKWAYVCFALDVLKGLIPTLLALHVIKSASTESGTSPAATLCLWILASCATIVGHVFPIYLKFKGGKGVSTSFGVALGIWPYYTLCAVVALAVWVIFALKWRYVSLASMAASAAFLATFALSVALVPSWSFSILWPLLIVAAVIPASVFLRHRENIGRLMNGTESKILQKKQEAAET